MLVRIFIAALIVLGAERASSRTLCDTRLFAFACIDLFSLSSLLKIHLSLLLIALEVNKRAI